MLDAGGYLIQAGSFKSKADADKSAHVACQEASPRSR